MTRVIKRGFIRIRYRGSRNDQHWSIQLNKLNSRTEDYLWTWAKKMVDSRIATDKFADVYIHQLSNNNMVKTSLNKILSGGSIKETKIYQEDEVFLLEDYFSYASKYLDILHEDAQVELSEREGLNKMILSHISSSDNINESSLSRVFRHNEEHDCGALTAFRKARTCNEGEPYTEKERKQRNKSLLTKLLYKGYGVTKLKGRYPEGGKSVEEESFFVVDMKNTGNLESDLISLGEEFEQDSILFIPKGAVIKKTMPYLIGTNHCINNEIGYKKKIPFEKGRFGYDSKIYTSYVNGRPFIFEEVDRECCMPGSGMGNWAVYLLSKANWKDIDV